MKIALFCAGAVAAIYGFAKTIKWLNAKFKKYIQTVQIQEFDHVYYCKVCQRETDHFWERYHESVFRSVCQICHYQDFYDTKENIATDKTQQGGDAYGY